MNLDIVELETIDYDIMENFKVAICRLRKKMIIPMLAAVIGILGAVIFISLVGVKTSYRSVASIYSAVYGSYEDSTDGVKVMNTYASLLNTSRVCERAAESLKGYGIQAEELRSMANSGRIYLSGASTESKSYGYRLSLVVTLDEPWYIAEIANAMAQAFADEINDLLGNSTLQVLDVANSYSSFKSINVLLVFVLFSGACFVLAAGIIFVIEFMSPKVYSIGQCELDDNLLLGYIPYDKRLGKVK